MARHGVIVLAAGDSRRLGQAKQLLSVDGEALLYRVARLGLATAPADCLVVLGADADRMRALLRGLPLRSAVCNDYQRGMAASLQTGLTALDAGCSGALVLLTDQPALDEAHLTALCECWRAQPSRAVASGYARTIGVPALLPRAWFAAAMQIEGDRGARELLRDRADEIAVIAAPQLARDIDRPEDLPRSPF
ncbi:MAG: nucleotidyltransferase family protein [Rhodanobacteraceae bacterium]